MFWQVLLHAGAETEVRAVADEHNGLKIVPCCQLIEGQLQPGHHQLINDVRLGSSKDDTGHLSLVLEFQPDFIGGAHHFPACVACAVQGATS
jgi:hypothetical protein